MYINGKMAEYTREIGSIIRCMEKAGICGKMGSFMKDFLNLIKSTDLEFIDGLTARFMRDSGKTGNKMGTVELFCQTAIRNFISLKTALKNSR